MSPRTARFAPIAAVFLAMVACRDVAGPGPALEQGLRPVLILGESGGGSAHTSLALVPRGTTDRLGAVQGQLEYDTVMFRLRDADVIGDRIGFVKEVRPGTIRFAVAAPAGLAGEPIIGLRWDVSRALEARGFVIRFETVVSPDFADLRSKVLGGEGLLIQGQ
jgi:hypothetical protein